MSSFNISASEDNARACMYGYIAAMNDIPDTPEQERLLEPMRERAEDGYECLPDIYFHIGYYRACRHLDVSNSPHQEPVLTDSQYTRLLNMMAESYFFGLEAGYMDFVQTPGEDKMFRCFIHGDKVTQKVADAIWTEPCAFGYRLMMNDMQEPEAADCHDDGQNMHPAKIISFSERKNCKDDK